MKKQNELTHAALVNPFDKVKRDFEKAYLTGDYAMELYNVGAAFTAAVLKALDDTRRKSAVTDTNVSNTGSPVIHALRVGVQRDKALLEHTAMAARTATDWSYNKEGDVVIETVDVNAQEAFDKLIRETLSDSIDLVHWAIESILDSARNKVDNLEIGWMDRPIPVKRTKGKIYRPGEEVEYITELVTPGQLAYRAVRDKVDGSRAVRLNFSRYVYIEDYIQDGEDLDIVYRRLKARTIGSMTTEGDPAILPGAPEGIHLSTGGYWTADGEDAKDLERLTKLLGLTARMAVVFKYRLEGYKLEEIGKKLGVKKETIVKTLQRIQDKAVAVGITPRGWTDTIRADSVEKAVPVVQENKNGVPVAVYSSISAAAKTTGVNVGSIKYCLTGRYKTAGGYIWKKLEK